MSRIKIAPKDPVKVLQTEGKKLKDLTAKKLRKYFEKSLLKRLSKY